ncbi:metalloregulator ArsR/SmtB family transcription factor [Dactylosporangium sp. NPDC051485]|uniref:ArsR/SmtB family transcription factor n=1 Tax=Dactylosporangium sp. NPDC051485 TaxID=3154846 RepID=UPI00341C7DDE
MPDDVLRALAHPLRLRMLNLIWPGPLSAAELARELSISHALASQHLRRLAAAGLVELAEERNRRGGHERRYRTVHGSPLSDQREGAPFLAEALAVGLRERAARRDPEHAGATTDGELWVAPEEWERYRSGIQALGDALHAAARPPRTPGTVPVAVTVHAFRMTPPLP